MNGSWARLVCELLCAWRLIPRLETNERECWKFLETGSWTQIMIREYTVNLLFSYFIFEELQINSLKQEQELERMMDPGLTLETTTQLSSQGLIFFSLNFSFKSWYKWSWNCCWGWTPFHYKSCGFTKKRESWKH